MSTTAEAEKPPVKSSRTGLVLGLILALVGAGGGFFIAYSGMLAPLLGGDDHPVASDESHGQDAADDGHGSRGSPQQNAGNTGFVPIEAITISLGPRGQSRHLRFAAQLEVAVPHIAEVQHLMPRITDVLNIYLRALDPHELEEPAALLRLRAQMLRRVQIVTGPGFVSDLLVMEFVLN
jgi:flagellar FliL protein